MMLGRVLLTLGALVLIGTAVFHCLGGAMVSGWLSGERGLVLQTLWYIPTLDWSAVGLAWLFIAWRGDRRWSPLVWLVSLIPAGAAAMIAYALGPYFLGFWLLAAATLLALLGSIALPRPIARPAAPSP